MSAFTDSLRSTADDLMRRGNRIAAGRMLVAADRIDEADFIIVAVHDKTVEPAVYTERMRSYVAQVKLELEEGKST